NLFALNLAKKSGHRRLILSEGYMDVVSLHQAGFDCAVASLGTSLTEEQASLMARYKNEVVIAYDSDEAGIKAAQRAIGILGKTGLSVKVLRMEGAKDPDEFIKSKGTAAFSQLLDRSENHIEYRLNLIRLKHDLDQSAERVAYLSEAIALLTTLESAVEREVYGAKVAEAAGVTPESVAAEVKRELKKRLASEKKRKERRELRPSSRLQPPERSMRYVNLRSARAEEGIIRLALIDPTVFDSIGSLTKEDFSSEFLGRVFEALYVRYQNGNAVTIPSLSGKFEPAEMAQIAAIAEQPESSDNILKALADYIDIVKTERSKREGGRDLLEIRSKLRQKEGILENGR
ncbi:MAG: toprim domain-containing protein, partial [Oscillospiraceae bacterium]